MVQAAIIVDTDDTRAEAYAAHIGLEFGMETHHYRDGEQLLRDILSGQVMQPDIILHTWDPSLRKTIETLHRVHPNLPVIVLVDLAHADKGMESVTLGAENFLVTPCHASQMTVAIRNAIARRDLQAELRHALSGFRISIDDLTLESKGMQATMFLARGLAASDSPVVLEGAPGSGRELFARAIHGSSNRHGQPFMSFNAALIAPKYVAQALFGGKSGIGALEEVGEGTLLIRNIDVVSESIRDELIAVLEARRPLFKDGQMTQRFKGRLMFAIDDAPRRLSAKEKRDILDFYSRINALPLSIPYLKDIADDIPYLAAMYCRRFSALEGKTILGISPEAAQILKEISWPGNMEQLSQAVLNAVLLCKGHELTVEDFHQLMHPLRREVSYLTQLREGSHVSGANPDGTLSCMDESGNVRRLQDVEQEIIRYALDRYSGHMSEVARFLGIGRSTLYRKLSSMDEEK